MNPDLPPISREELEVRLTALLLGELPPAEAEAVRALAANDAELAQLLARLEQAITLVREGLTISGETVPATPPPAKLSPGKRAHLLAHFQTPPASTGERALPHPGPLPLGEGGTGSSPAGSEGARTFLSAGASAAEEASRQGHGPADKNVRAPVAVTPEAMGVKRLAPKRGKYRWLINTSVTLAVMVLLAALLLPSLQVARQKRPSYVTALPGSADMAMPELPRGGKPTQLSGQIAAGPPPTPLPEPAPTSVTALSSVTKSERLRTEIALPAAVEDEVVQSAGGLAGNFGWAGNRGGGGFGGGGSGGGREGWDFADLSDLKRDGAAQSEWQAPMRGDRLPAPPAGAITAPTAPAEKPPTVMLGDALVGSDFVAPLTGLVPGDMAGLPRAELRMDPASATPAGPKPGAVAAGQEFAFGASADRRASGISARSGAAGQPTELFAKAQTTDEVQLGFVADPSARQSSGGRENATVTHFFADTDLPAVVTATRKLELNRIASPADAEALGRQPARPASPFAAGGVASAATASVPAQNPGGIRLPMPSLKGTPEDLPIGGNIEGLAETEAKAKAQWDTLAANVAQPAATPPPGMGPEMQARFARRYGLPAPGSPQPEVLAADDSKKAVPNLGNVPMLGALFKGQAAELDGDQGGIAPATRLADGSAPAKDANLPTAPSFAGAAIVGGGANQVARGTSANDAWFDDGAAGGLQNRSDSQRGRAIVLPPAEPQAERFLQDGKLLYESGRLEEARDKFARAQAVAPGDSRAEYYGSLVAAGQTAKENAGKQVTAQTEVTSNWALQLAQPPVAAGRGLGLQEAPKDELKSLSSGLGARPQSVAAPMEKKLAEAVTDAKLKQVAELQAKYDKYLQRMQHLDVSKEMAPESIGVLEPAKAETTATPNLLDRTKAALGAGEVERSARLTASVPQAVPQAGAYQEEIANYLGTQAALIKSGTVLKRVAEKLNLSESEARQLEDKVAVSVVPRSSTFNIQARDASPERAAKIANAVAEEYLQFKKEMRVTTSDTSMAGATEELLRLERELKSAQDELERIAPLGGAAQQQAEPPPPPKPPANAPIPQPEVASAENAFSTFSLNVADVSFKLAAASLEQGVLPEVASLRSEEFLNAFDYRDAEPAPGAPVAFAWERARDPFAHNRDFLRFSLKTAASGRQAGRPLNLVLLLDNSGSMERADRVQIIQQAMRVLAGQLQAQDRISVVTFARTPRLWLDAVPGDKAGEAVAQIAAIVPQGGTDLGGALQLGYDTARRHYLPGGLNRVVLLTDGAANLGDVDPDSLKRKVEAHRQQGIALDCFGIGWDGYNDDLLENLSRNGDGRYGFVNTPEAAATEFAAQLAGALQVAASDVKVQVEFNPARVTHWRQIGYAKHQLTKEQFRDNAVDAAEIAAQEAGNGLYVIETNPQGQGPLATVRVRYKVPGTADYREIEWSVPYTGNAVPLAQAGPALRLAVAATGFAEWLAGSPFAAEVTPDRLLGLLGGVAEAYGADERPKKLEWMIRQAKSLSGK